MADTQFNDESIELIKLKAEALDTGHLKLATWGTKKQLICTLRNNGLDPCRNKYGNIGLKDNIKDRIKIL